MGGIKFEKSMNNINNFLEFKKKTNDKKVYTMGNFINIKENKHQMKQWIDTWQPKLR